MNIFAIFPDEAYMRSMSVHTMEKPSLELQKNGVVCLPQGQFFSGYCDKVNNQDIVIMWIGTRNESWIDLMTSLPCRKFLRNIDSCKSDRVLFKREQEIFHRIGFEAMLVTYCTDANKKFLADRNIRCIEYPHFINFENSYRLSCREKKYDILISGQMSSHSYPTRTRISDVIRRSNKYKAIFLPHPGHSKQHASHSFFGEEFIKLASTCRLGVVCTGDDDSMVMKYLEFAKSGTLPIGDVPSNMPAKSSESMLVIDKSDTDEEIIQKIDKILCSPASLEENIANYVEGMRKFDIVENTKAVLDKIRRGIYDS